MINLGSWMNKVLTGWGVDEKIANTFDEAIIAILLVAVAIGLDYLCQAIFVGGVRSIVKHTHYKWDTLLIKRKVVHYLVHTIPGILVYACSRWLLSEERNYYSFPRRFARSISYFPCC